MKRLVLCFFAFPCFAADVKPTFTLEQAQAILNLSTAEMKVAIGAGNYPVIEQLAGVSKEIIRAAQEAQRLPAPAAPATPPQPSEGK